MGSRQQHRNRKGAKGRGNNASAVGGARSRAKSRDLKAQRGGGGQAVRGRTSMAMDREYRAARGTVRAHPLRRMAADAAGYHDCWAVTVDLGNGNGRARVSDSGTADWPSKALAVQKGIEALKGIYYAEPYTARLDRTLQVPA